MPIWKRMRVAAWLCVVCAGVVSAAPAWGGAGKSSGEKGGVELATLNEKMGSCNLASLDGVKIRITESEWNLKPERHSLRFACDASKEDTRAFIREKANGWRRLRTWHFERELAFEPRPGGRYVAKDFIDSGLKEYVWIEDAGTGEVAAGERAQVVEGPELIPKAELQRAIEELGDGSTLLIEYKAPKDPVNRMQVKIERKVVVDVLGNEDLERTVSAAPGEYEVEVIVQSKGEFRTYSNKLEVKLGKGRKRTLKIKASAWGLPSVRLK